MIRPLLALMLLPLLAVGAPVPNGLKAKPVSPDGTWELVSIEASGVVGLPTNVYWDIRDGSVSQLFGSESVFTLTVTDAEKGELDVIFPEPLLTRKDCRLGVFKRDGDILRLSVAHIGRGRPADRKSGSHHDVYTLKRFKVNEK